MLSQGSSSVASQPLRGVPPKILESRDQYQPCHIRVPDSPQPLPAIAVDDQYYSFFRVAKDLYQALDFRTKLLRRGSLATITKTAKGYIVWVLEPDATLEVVSSMPKPQESLGSNRVLESRSEYQPCHIHVPDLDQPLAAICVEGEYYSFFKVVKDQNQAVTITTRLSHRGDRTVITKTGARGYVVWVFEPDATRTQER